MGPTGFAFQIQAQLPKSRLHQLRTANQHPRPLLPAMRYACERATLLGPVL